MELCLKNNPDRMRLLVQKVFNIQRARGKTNAVIGEISCPSWQRDKGHEGHEWTRRDLLSLFFILYSWLLVLGSWFLFFVLQQWFKIFPYCLSYNFMPSLTGVDA